MTWREALRETEIGPLLCILGVLLALAALIAVTAKSTEDSILYMAHGITCGALLVMPWAI
jgi:VIT1/CCC1 family predicted Fe2+/Mn2+ transporter